MDTVNSSSSALWLVNRAPHPNAAKVFINWLLTKDAQVVWAREVETNSRRVGVEPGNPAVRGAPGRQALPGRRRGKSARSREDPGHRQGGHQVGAVAAPAPGSGETVLALDGVSKLFGAAAAVDRASLDDPARRDLHPARPERLRQDHHPPARRRPRAARRGRDHPARPRRRLRAAPALRAAEQAQPRHGLPVLRDLAAHDRLRERRLSARAARDEARRHPRQGRPRARPRRPRGTRDAARPRS